MLDKPYLFHFPTATWRSSNCTYRQSIWEYSICLCFSSTCASAYPNISAVLQVYCSFLCKKCDYRTNFPSNSKNRNSHCGSERNSVDTCQTFSVHHSCFVIPISKFLKLLKAEFNHKLIYT